MSAAETNTTNEIFIKLSGKDYGPFSEKELAREITSGRVPFSAWVFFNENWQLLAEMESLRTYHPEFQQKPKGAPNKKTSQDLKALEQSRVSATASSVPSGATVSAEPVWFVIREKKKFGPYSSADIVGQLQRKQLDSNAFVWRPGFATWQRMSQVAEFSRDSMRRLADESAAVDILVKRKFARAPYEVEVVAHDNTRAIEGKTMVIGEGGLFLATSKPMHQIGARLKLHFRPGKSEETASFNAVAEVVSVIRSGDAAGYCLRFIAISETDRRRIAKFISEQGAHAGKRGR